MSRRLPLPTLALLVALLAVALTATSAIAATPRTTLNDVEDEVMCVSCGVPLNIAESPQADRERALIRRLIDRGLTKEQVKAELKAELGPRVIAEPDKSGFGLAAWLVPLVLVLGALGALAVFVPRWRRTRGGAADVPLNPDAPTGPALDADDARRLDEDLARYDL